MTYDYNIVFKIFIFVVLWEFLNRLIAAYFNFRKIRETSKYNKKIESFRKSTALASYIEGQKKNITDDYNRKIQKLERWREFFIDLSLLGKIFKK